MAEAGIKHRAVLAGLRPINVKQVDLRALPEGSIIQILARRGAGDLAPLLADLTADKECEVRPAAPGEWLLVGNTAWAREELDSLEASIHAVGYAVDQSHGRVRLSLAGPAVEDVLAKGSAVDFDAAAFPIGNSTVTLIGHVSVHLTRMKDSGFELIVGRSLAEGLWQDLARMSSELA